MPLFLTQLRYKCSQKPFEEEHPKKKRRAFLPWHPLVNADSFCVNYSAILFSQSNPTLASQDLNNCQYLSTPNESVLMLEPINSWKGKGNWSLVLLEWKLNCVVLKVSHLSMSTGAWTAHQSISEKGQSQCKGGHSTEYSPMAKPTINVHC